MAQRKKKVEEEVAKVQAVMLKYGVTPQGPSSSKRKRKKRKEEKKLTGESPAASLGWSTLGVMTPVQILASAVPAGFSSTTGSLASLSRAENLDFTCSLYPAVTRLRCVCNMSVAC